MYEPRHSRPLPRAAYLWRLARHGAVAALIIAGSLVVGAAGYSWFEGLGAQDAFLHEDWDRLERKGLYYAMWRQQIGERRSSPTPIGTLALTTQASG